MARRMESSLLGIQLCHGVLFARKEDTGQVRQPVSSRSVNGTTGGSPGPVPVTRLLNRGRLGLWPCGMTPSVPCGVFTSVIAIGSSCLSAIGGALADDGSITTNDGLQRTLKWRSDRIDCPRSSNHSCNGPFWRMEALKPSHGVRNGSSDIVRKEMAAGPRR